MDASKPRGNRISREGRAYFKALGRRIARLRGEMSQGKLGQILGVTEDTVAAIERGERRPPLAAMPKLAAHFGVSMNDLVDDPRPLPPKMQQHLERLARLDGLDEKDQAFILELVEMLLRR